MLLNNDFIVEAPAAQAWTLLTDLERVATCLPGATLDGRQDDAYVGGVKIKVGPITANFHGTARFVEQDDAGHSATIAAAGKDPKGQAAANATIRARLQPEGPTRTRVLVDTELDISGRMAQFGRGAIADVSVRLMNQFADNLGAQIAAGSAPATGVQSAAPSTAPVSAASPAAPAGGAAAAGVGMNALALIGPVLAKRLGPGFAVAVAGLSLGWVLRGARERRRPWYLRLLPR